MNTVIKRDFLNYKSVLKNSFFFKFYLEINVYSYTFAYKLVRFLATNLGTRAN